MSEELKLKIKNYFRVQRMAFAALGMNVLHNASESFLKRPFVWLLMVVSMASHVVAMLIYCFIEVTDVYTFTDTFVSMLEAFMSVFKIVVFTLKRRKIVKLIQRLRKHNMETTDEAEFALVIKQNAKETRLSKLFCCSTIFVATTAMVNPLLNALFKYKANGGFKPRTPLEFDFWLDHTQPFNYCLIWIWNFIAIYAIAWVTIGIDSLFSWLVHNIVIQFHILGHRFQCAAQTCVGDHPSPEIIECMRFHILTLDIAQELNDAYSEVLLVNFMPSYLHIGSLAFRFARGDYSEQTLFHVVFLSSALIRMALYCFGGENIKTESEIISDKIFCAFDWHNVRKANVKMLLIAMSRARRACEVSVYIFNIDRELFLWVIRTAGSFITMLKTFQN